MGYIEEFQDVMENSFHGLVGDFVNDQKIRIYTSETSDDSIEREIYFTDNGKKLKIEIKLVET